MKFVEATMAFATLGFRFALASVILFAGVSKLGRRNDLERTISDYRLLPGVATRPIAAWLPWIEIFTGLLLGLGIAVMAAAVVALLLSTTFAAAMTVNLVRGRRIECGCFGGARQLSWPGVVLNVLLGAMAITLIAQTPQSLDLWRGWTLHPASSIPTDEGVATLFASTALVGLLLMTTTAWSLLRTARSASFSSDSPRSVL